MQKRRFGHIETPLQRIHIELTNVCNFNCTFCPKSEMERKPGFMDTGLAKRIISEIRREELCRKITFHVMGEPTLHPDFLEILDHAERVGMPVGLTTNGSTLGKRLGRSLLGRSLHQIDVSLQTPDEASFELRGAGRLTFDRYVEDVMGVLGDYIPRHPETRVKLRFLTTRFPSKELERRKGPVRVISSSGHLRETFQQWAGRIYDVLGVAEVDRERPMAELGRLGAYQWHVVEVYPNVFFETYMLSDWGHAFGKSKVRDAWAAYCYGMRDHFGILSNGDVVLCFMDFEGRTAIGNLHEAGLEDVLSSDRLKAILDGFRRMRPVHPHCKRCRGSAGLASWLLKPAASLIALKLLRPLFYAQRRVCGDLRPRVQHFVFECPSSPAEEPAPVLIGLDGQYADPPAGPCERRLKAPLPATTLPRPRSRAA